MFAKSWSYFLLVFLSLHFFVSADSYEKKTVCLNMIVKNESAVIQRCLASVKPLIDYWVIVDTGSTDGTQEMIQAFMKDIPGELHERPWKNFGHNRTEALELAQSKGDYLLFIDADEVLLYAPDFKFPHLDKDFYYVTTEYSGTHYARVQLINNHLKWKWVGVLHETVECPQASASETMQGLTNFVHTDGFRSQDPQKFLKDAQILESALAEDPHNSRYVFYLAQSYKDAKEYEKAIAYYEQRIKMGGWDQEIFWSKLQIALLQELLNKEPDIVTNGYLNAYFYRPTRLEPLYRLASYYRRNEKYPEGYQIACLGLHLRPPPDSLFVERWMYNYGLLLEYSLCAYWTERYQESLLASYLILSNPNLPVEIKTCLQSNLKWIHAKLEEAVETHKNALFQKQ
ncbi:glycosyltransferase [Parachlamydia sp. AcF125]|uniref:tetratricopeptide repeat-containing glycosyltransferase n=1 Tax=Parachlamydia sp. AcF125 TaxID=2795736 RepID=UPI001BCA6010|nr:glycosyltransferase [Parachlamydia sp. AcF125]MBS4167622.1 SPBc2 prophage-derived glycosyltransferase SunS [Parachlamydia sp. AcF125]